MQDTAAGGRGRGRRRRRAGTGRCLYSALRKRREAAALSNEKVRTDHQSIGGNKHPKQCQKQRSAGSAVDGDTVESIGTL